jgi:hypothetical protein
MRQLRLTARLAYASASSGCDGLPVDFRPHPYGFGQ